MRLSGAMRSSASRASGAGNAKPTISIVNYAGTKERLPEEVGTVYLKPTSSSSTP